MKNPGPILQPYGTSAIDETMIKCKEINTKHCSNTIWHQTGQ